MTHHAPTDEEIANARRFGLSTFGDMSPERIRKLTYHETDKFAPNAFALLTQEQLEAFDPQTIFMLRHPQTLVYIERKYPK